MKFNAFLYKLFPCMKNYEQPQSPRSPQSCLQLYKQRQKLLEESVEAEQQEAERVEAEQQEAEQQEAERVETERVETERVEAEQQEAERVETERVETERVEAERVEAERVETERVETERVETERVETERVETERVEAERVETERVEAERVETERVVDNMFRQYMDKFHEFFSSRTQPIHSNFNEKMFKDLCDTFTFNTEGELLECLDRYNLMQKQNKKAYNQLSRKRKLKCDVFKFYLFI